MWNYNSNGYLNNNNFYNGNVVEPVGWVKILIDMVELTALLHSADEAEKRKRKSKETVKFLLNKQVNIIKLWKSINNRTYVHDGNYAFVVMIPKPREIFATSYKNRIVHHYLYERIMPLIDKHVPKRTFSNRKGLGGDRAIKQVWTDIYNLSNKYTEDCWIMKVDIKGYFPNAKWDLAFAKLKKLVEEEYFGEDKEDVLYLLHECLYANPITNCEKRGDVTLWRYIEPEKSLFNKPYGTGAAIGWLIWQMTMLYYLVDLDVYLNSFEDVKYVRFVDDIVIIGKDKNKMLKMMNTIREIVHNNGCELNEKKFYFQHYSKGLEFLGSHIKFNRIYVNNKTIYRMMCKVRFLNGIKDKESYIHKFQQCMNSYFGIMKKRSELKTIYRMVWIYITKDWWIYIKMNPKRHCIQIRSNFK